MKRQFNSTILRYGSRLFACCLLANSISLRAQNTAWMVSSGAPSPNGTNVTVTISAGGSGQSGGGVGLVINGSDIGTILLKTCDLNHDGTVSLAELKDVADASFKLWDTNNVGSLTQADLSTDLKSLFPAPPPDGRRVAMRDFNGVVVQVPPDQMPTPMPIYAQLAKQIFAAADANQDGSLNLQEVNDWLDKNFSQWDQNGDGGLNSSELNAAFGQLAKPN